MNASDLEQIHLCSFGMLAALPSSKYSFSVKRSGTNIGMSLIKAHDLGTLVLRLFPLCMVEVERM